MAQTKPTIIGLPGSLRSKSYNRMLLNAAIDVSGSFCQMEPSTIQDIPLYSQDDEDTKGIPAAVKDLQDQLASCDGLLIVSPEYNNSIPGVMKNAIDYLSRPPKDIGRVFKGLPVAVIGTTPGGRGTFGAQNAWLPVFHTLGMKTFSGEILGVPKASEVFNAEGKLTDAKLRERLEKFMQHFAKFVSENKRF